MKNKLTIKETQDISLEILHTVAKICDNLQLRYCLMYGTLIGAIRHNGFIPWDDDIDIMMPRPDYDKLLNYLKDNIDKYPFLRIFNPNICDKYPYMITRISDDRYEIVMKNEKSYGMGVFIDIYPFDGLGIDYEKSVKYGKKGDRLSSLCYLSTRKHFAIETTTSIFRKIIKFPFFLISKMFGKNFFQNKLSKLANKYKYDDSKYVGCVVWLSGGEKDIFPKEWFDETISWKYDKYEFNIPKQYDKILTRIYGDYMQLPPKKDRIGHHYYDVYKR